MENPSNRVMYYLLDGLERAFVSEELMLIPEDTELPPHYVQEWYYLSRWIDIMGPCSGPESTGLIHNIPLSL